VDPSSLGVIQSNIVGTYLVVQNSVAMFDSAKKQTIENSVAGMPSALLL
jgi:hypothetical protein